MTTELMTPKERARALLDEVFADAVRVPFRVLSERAKTNEVSIQTLRRVATERGDITIVRGGPAGSFWERRQPPKRRRS